MSAHPAQSALTEQIKMLQDIAISAWELGKHSVSREEESPEAADGVRSALAELIKLVKRIAALLETQKNTPWEAVLWTADDIGAYLQVSPRTVAEKYAPKPGFPTALRPGGGYPRWFAAEIIDWVEDSRRKTRRTYTKRQ